MFQSTHKDLTHINEVASLILSKLSSKKNVILVNGDLGSGKTTLAKEIGKKLGIEEMITSPTFTVLKEYNIENGKFIHIDAYRVGGDEEIIDLIQDYLEPNNILYIEWASLIERELNVLNPININIEFSNNNDERIYTIND